MDSLRPLLALSLAAVACASGSGREDPDETLVIALAWEPPASCRVSFLRHTFVLPGEEEQLRQALVRERAQRADALVAGDAGIPYRCFGHAVFVAQGAGFESVGFIAEPPTARDP